MPCVADQAKTASEKILNDVIEHRQNQIHARVEQADDRIAAVLEEVEYLCIMVYILAGQFS